MGVSSSKVEEDKALLVCRERKKFVRQALDGRCSLAATHVTYIESLRVIGSALRKFIEPEAPIEASLYTSTSAIPEPLALTERSVSQFSFSSTSPVQHLGAARNLSPSPPPTTKQNHTNHMKVRASASTKVEEKPPVPVIGSVTSSTNNKSADGPETSMPSETPPWDYFGLFHPTDNDVSSQEGRVLNQGLDYANEMRRVRDEEGIPEMEEEEDIFPRGRDEFQESEDEFDEPSADLLVRSFENVNRAADNVAPYSSPSLTSASESEFMNRGKRSSPVLSPLKATLTGASIGARPGDEKVDLTKEEGTDKKVVPKDFVTSIKEVEYLFVKASECGREVPRMLEANKFHFRPIFPGKERRSTATRLLKTCFSCGDDPSQVPEEPAQTTTKYLTWHRTMSSRTSSFRLPPGENIREEAEDPTNNLFEDFCMNAGSHASTLDRLYAWERKLYDEVKASEMVRRLYDQKRKLLRELESNGQSSHRIDKTRAIVKDLHSRIGVSIHRINSISRRIEDLRDKELQPQLEELIEGLRKMWEGMFECHKVQFDIISVAYNNTHTRISSQPDSHRQITIHLESELSSLSSSFTKWILAQKTYVEALNGWLYKCVSLQQKSSKRKRRQQPPPLRNYGPPIYVTCGVWLDLLKDLPTKDVEDSIKGLAAEISNFLPRQEKNQGKNANRENEELLRDDSLEDWKTGFDRLKSSLVGFLGQLSHFSMSSVKMFTDLQKSIQERKDSYTQSRNHNYVL